MIRILPVNFMALFSHENHAFGLQLNDNILHKVRKAFFKAAWRVKRRMS